MINLELENSKRQKEIKKMMEDKISLRKDIPHLKRFDELPEEKKHNFLDRLYSPFNERNGLLDSVNYSRHYLGRAIPRIIRNAGKKYIDEIFKEFEEVNK